MLYTMPPGSCSRARLRLSPSSDIATLLFIHLVKHHRETLTTQVLQPRTTGGCRSVIVHGVWIMHRDASLDRGVLTREKRQVRAKSRRDCPHEERA